MHGLSGVEVTEAHLVKKVPFVEDASSSIRVDYTPKAKNLVYSIQQIRAIAAVLVVMTHVKASMGLEPGSFSLDLREINSGFTFAAGFLFHLLSINKPYKEFIIIRLKNVLVPYMFISVPAIAVYVIGGKNHASVDFSQIPHWFLPIYLYLTGLHLGPLWFVPMILVIYGVTPLMKIIDKANFYWITIPITLILSTLIFTRPLHNDMPLLAAAHYFPVFLLGMLCSRHRVLMEEMAAKFWGFALISLVLIGLLCGSLNEIAQFPAKIAMLTCLFLITCRTQVYRAAIIDILAKYSFGIFLIHGYFAGVIRMFRGKIPYMNGSFFNVIIVTAVLTVLCLFLIWSIKRVLGSRSRLLIGV